MTGEQRLVVEANVLRRRLRLVLLIDAAQRAGFAPVSILPLHMLAYLSNVLAPVWDMPILEGKVLKRRGGPFYPSLQAELDALVGQGTVLISSVSYQRDEDNRWRLEGSYLLNKEFSHRILEQVAEYAQERQLANFLRELAFALSSLDDDELSSAMVEDATYADLRTDFGGVVDFAEWREKNYSANAAAAFSLKSERGQFSPTPGEKLHFYMRHLQSRLQRAAIAV